jgi:hypothetical protein
LAYQPAGRWSIASRNDHQLTDASLLLRPHHPADAFTDRVDGKHPYNVDHQGISELCIGLVLNPQELHLSAKKFTPSGILREAE